MPAETGAELPALTIAKFDKALHDRSALLIKDKDDRERALAEGSKLSRTALIVFMVGGLVAVLVGF